MKCRNKIEYEIICDKIHDNVKIRNKKSNKLIAVCRNEKEAVRLVKKLSKWVDFCQLL